MDSALYKEFKGDFLSKRSGLSMCSFVEEYGDVRRKCLLLEIGIILRESGDQLDSQQLGILLVTWAWFLED